MKILTSGDIHGRTCWKEINPDNYDYIIFVGDYLDSFDVKNYDMFINLVNIIDFKKKYPDKVILLWGNHDLYYYFGGMRRHWCSGGRPEMIYDWGDLLRTNRRLFQSAFQIDNYIWTHAGIHLGWYDKYIKKQIEPGDVNLADTLNRLFEMNYDPLFNVSWIRGGTSKEGGIFWADKQETSNKPLPEYNQILGHTPVNKITTIERSYKNKPSATVTYVDVLGGWDDKEPDLDFKDKFYELEI